MANSIEPESADMGDPGRIPATTPDDVLDVFGERDDRAEPLTAPELADRLNCSRRTALNKLHDLEDRDDVASKKVGGRSKVWWRPIRRDQSPPASARESATESTPASGEESAGGASTSQPTGDGETRSTAPHGGERDGPAGGALRGWEPDTEADAGTARAQTRRAAEWLRADGGRHTKADFVDALADGSELGDRSWWERAVQPGLRRLADQGLIEYRGGYHDYRWSGGERERDT